MRGSNHDQLVQKGCKNHGESKKEEREARGETTKSAIKRTEADKIDSVLQGSRSLAILAYVVRFSHQADPQCYSKRDVLTSYVPEQQYKSH